jgi:hypothetical protein
MTPEAVAIGIAAILMAITVIAARALFWDWRDYREEQARIGRIRNEINKRGNDDGLKETT